jgi:hypothetical protein
VVHTIQESWGAHWSFDQAVVACELETGNAKVLDQLDLPEGAYDLRAAGGTLWFSTWGGDSVVSSPGSGTSGGHSGHGNGKASPAKIGTVRLDASLSFGPKLVLGEHFASLLLAEGQSALVVVDGVALGRWEVGAGTAVQSWSHELGGWPQAARPDGATPGAYVLALGYGGSLIVP